LIGTSAPGVFVLIRAIRGKG